MDVVIAEEVVARNIAQVNPELYYKVLDDIDGEASVIVFPKGSTLVPEVSQAIQMLKERGEIELLMEKWFVNGPDDLESTWATVRYIFGGIKVDFGFNSLFIAMRVHLGRHPGRF